MNLENLKSIFSDFGCEKIYIKNLSPNDNSKNQVYFAGNFEILNILPIKNIIAIAAGNWENERFMASLDFSWLDDDGNAYPAPNSKLILYPSYPEVRFSGFLAGCKKAPSLLMTQRLANRLLFFSVTNTGKVVGYVASPESEIAKEYNSLKNLNELGVFKLIELINNNDNKIQLISELLRIHQNGWIKSRRLDRDGNILPCEAPNCGGYTLEAELGIRPNGYSEPDFLGWEIKQFGVVNFDRVDSAIITLMTPEPTNGFYKQEGVEAFIRNYGYQDKNGKPDRLNFGGVHKANIRHSLTNLTLQLEGFDAASGKIRNASGKIALIDLKGNIAASWDFASLLLHWNRKHNQACYIPSLADKNTPRKYKYGNNIILGTGTDFQLFLTQMSLGNIYYDPGIKMEDATTKPKIKKRSQFRIKSSNLPRLYKVNEVLNISK